MIRTMLGAAMLLVGTIPAGADAKDTKPCPADMVCASKPETVAAALMKAGYQGLIGKDKLGDPMIDSAAAGYKFAVFFYGCENHAACDSVQFYAGFQNEEKRGIDFANKWNATKRFSQMAVDPSDGGLLLRYDATTAGGVNQANFADLIDWYVTMLGSYDSFRKENPVAEAGK